MAKADWNTALMQIAGMIQEQRAMKQRRQVQQQQMAQDKARMEQDRELAMKRIDQETKRLKSDNAYRQALIKSSELDDKKTELGIQQEAELAEFQMLSEPKTETAGDVTKRGVEQLTRGVGGDVGLLSSIAALGKNFPTAARTVMEGPQTTPGMTRAEFIAQEQAQGVPMAALGGLPEAEKTNYTQMKAAFDMSIVYGLELPAEFKAMPGVVEAITKGRTAYTKAQTDAEKMYAIDIATAEARLKWEEWRAEHPGGVRSYAAPEAGPDIFDQILNEPPPGDEGLPITDKQLEEELEKTK